MSTEIYVEPVEKTEALTLIQKVAGVFTAPGQTFAAIGKNPSWLAPALLISVVNLIFILMASDIVLNEALTLQEKAMQERGMEQEQIDQMVATTEKFMKYFSPVTGVVVPIITVLIVAAVFMFVGNVVLGGSASYKQVLSVTAYSWLILSLSALITLPVVLAKESIQVTFSAAAVMPNEARTTFLYQLLAKIDIFYIWWLSVYSIGLAAIYKMKTQKVATAVVTVYAIYALIAASLTGLFS